MTHIRGIALTTCSGRCAGLSPSTSANAGPGVTSATISRADHFIGTQQTSRGAHRQIACAAAAFSSHAQHVRGQEWWQHVPISAASQKEVSRDRESVRSRGWQRGFACIIIAALAIIIIIIIIRAR